MPVHVQNLDASNLGKLISTSSLQNKDLLQYDSGSDRFINTASLDLSGGLSLPIDEVNSTTTLDSSYWHAKCDATSGAFTVNLPPAADNEGRIYVITKVDVTANTVTIDPSGSELINSDSTVSTTTQWNSYRLQSDGSNWIII
jgi:hypothetical protein